MNQDELVTKLTPAIGLRRQLDPRAHPKSEDCADPVVTIRPLRPAERAFSDPTLDTILVERETDRPSRSTLWHSRIFQLCPAFDLVPRRNADHHPPTGGRHQRHHEHSPPPMCKSSTALPNTSQPPPP